MYQAVVARRLQWDNLLWQVPVLSLTAQAFLFTTALSSEVASWGRIVASLLSLIISVLSILLMGRHRQGELTDAHWLACFETEVLKAGKWGAHGTVFRDARKFEGLDAGWVGRMIPLRPMFGVWVAGLALFGLAAIGVVITTATRLVL
jgi:hypothetical protein